MVEAFHLRVLTFLPFAFRRSEAHLAFLTSMLISRAFVAWLVYTFLHFLLVTFKQFRQKFRVLVLNCAKKQRSVHNRLCFHAKPFLGDPEKFPVVLDFVQHQWRDQWGECGHEKGSCDAEMDPYLILLGVTLPHFGFESISIELFSRRVQGSLVSSVSFPLFESNSIHVWSLKLQSWRFSL